MDSCGVASDGAPKGKTTVLLKDKGGEMAKKSRDGEHGVQEGCVRVGWRAWEPSCGQCACSKWGPGLLGGCPVVICELNVVLRMYRLVYVHLKDFIIKLTKEECPSHVESLSVAQVLCGQGTVPWPQGTAVCHPHSWARRAHWARLSRGVDPQSTSCPN